MILLVKRFLLRPTVPLWKYCLLAFPLALVPSILLALIARQVFVMLGANVDLISAPDLKATMGEFFGAVVFAPVTETLALALLIVALSRLSQRTLFIAVVSAILWGSLHGTFGALWFFGTAWSFFVFSCAYLHWRKQSFGRAFLAASVPHALVNATAISCLALASYAK